MSVRRIAADAIQRDQLTMNVSDKNAKIDRMAGRDGSGTSNALTLHRADGAAGW